MTPKQLREQRSKLIAEARALAELAATEGRDFTAEEQQRWDRQNEEINGLTRRIETLERAEELGRLDGRPVDGDRVPPEEGGWQRRRDRAPADERTQALAIQAWMRAQMGRPLSARHQQAAERCRIYPQARTLTLRLLPTEVYGRFRGEALGRQWRAMGVGVGASGGFGVGSVLVTNLEVAMLEFNAVRQVAEVIRTDRGEPMPWPTANDTGNEGELIGENAPASEQDVSLGQVVFGAHKFGSKMVRLSSELLEDNVVNLLDRLGGMLGERIGRRQNRAFTVGNGASQPHGLVTRAAIGKTAAATNALTADEILDLMHSVDPAYRQNAGFMLHDSILAVVRKLKDSQGRYLWSESPREGEPDRLWGRPLVINQHMASALAAAADVMLFGDFRKYKIRDAGVLRLRRLVERYADVDQEGFVAWSRSDGNLLDAGTGPVKKLRMAAA